MDFIKLLEQRELNKLPCDCDECEEFTRPEGQPCDILVNKNV